MPSDTEIEDHKPGVADELFLVGIGASAGGLEAISELLKAAPPQAPAAYVVAQHMSPKHKSLLTELIGRETHLHVREIEDGMILQANTAYVTPPKHDIVVRDDRLRLLSPNDAAAAPKPSVDRLFHSIAESFGKRSIGVILSGTGSDGSYGLRAIHDAGGTTIAQHNQTAKYDGMPLAAVRTGCVDLVLAPEEIGTQLGKLPGSLKGVQAILQESNRDALIAELFELLLVRTQVDFCGYKATTVERRIERRMAANGITTLSEYVALCRTNQTELDALYNDMLISVTRFFRDNSEFSALKVHIEGLVSRNPHRVLRVWVAGCATGEEAYSIAILFAEAMGGYANLDKSRLQIFATDLDEGALATARRGRYPGAASEDIDPKLLDTYFHTEGDLLNVRRGLRDVIVFSQHNVFQDPAFLRIDLVCCRNLLIYFGNDLQDRTLARFHSALESGGLLFLGMSETVTVSKDLFGRTDPALNLYRKRMVHNIDYATRFRPQPRGLPPATPPPSQSVATPTTTTDELFVGIARGLGDAVVLFDSNHRIRRVFGELDRFLTLAEGALPEMNYALLMEPLASEARMLVTMAIRTRRRQLGNVRRFDQWPEENIQLEVIPVLGPQHRDAMAVVTFNSFPAGQATRSDTSDDPNLAALQRELDATSSALTQTIEDLSTSNEELQSTTEEMQATNEELVALNEELETSNEELQSTNEELVTINEELTITSGELAALAEEQDSMLANIGIPVLIVNEDRRIAKASMAAESMFEIPAPNEKPHVSQCALPPGFPKLVDVVDHVFIKGEYTHREINSEGTRYTMRAHPIISQSGVITGVTLVLVQTPETESLADFVRNAQSMLMHRDRNGNILRISELSAKSLGTTVENAEGANLSEFLPQDYLEQVRARDLAFLDGAADSQELSADGFMAGSDQPVWITGGYHRLKGEHGVPDTLYVAATDTTEIRNAQKKLEARARQLEMSTDIAGISYWSLDVAEQSIYWSRGVYEIHGVTPQTYSPELESAIAFYHPDDRKLVQDTVSAALERQESFEFTARLVRADGEEIKVQSKCELDIGDDGEVRQLVGVFRRLD